MSIEDSFTRGSTPDRTHTQLRNIVSAGAAAGAVLDAKKKEPKTVEQAATWSYKSKDKHSLEGVFTTPSGDTYVSCKSFDWENKDRPKAYTAAFDPQGNRRWEYEAEKRYNIDEHLFLPDGRCYISCNTEERWSKPYVVALNPDGTQKWKFQPDKECKCNSIRLGPDGTIYAKFENQLVALDDKGQVKWKHKIGITSADYFHEMTPSGTNIFACDNFSNNFGYDSFEAVGPDGKKKKIDLPDIGTFPINDGKGAIYYGGEKGEFYGIDVDKGTQWSLQLDSERGLKTPQFGKDGNIYVEGRFDDTLYAISPGGKLLWKQVITDHRPEGMGLDGFYQVGADGRVYYAQQDKDVIQVIDARGNRGTPIDVAGGFSEFKVDSQGNMYIRRYDETIILNNMNTGLRFFFPMELATNMDMKEVLPDGTVVFQDMCDRFHVRFDKDEEVKKALEEIKAAQEGKDGEGAAASPDNVEIDDKWVIIGDVKIPRQ